MTLSVESPTPVYQQLRMSHSEFVKWVVELDVTVDEIAENNKTLVQELSTFSRNSTIPLLAGLLTVTGLHSHCARLEILVALAVVYCHGQKQANIEDVKNWFNQIGEPYLAHFEDPAEDIFVSLVQDGSGDYRILQGYRIGSGFYTQLVLNVITRMPDYEPFGQLKRSVRALLVISDVVCEKSELQRYEPGSYKKHSELTLDESAGPSSLISRVTITRSDLEKHELEFADIEKFIFTSDLNNSLLNQKVRDNLLNKLPILLQDDSQLVVALPSSLTFAVQNYVIDRMLSDSGLANCFYDELKHCFSQSLMETPLLGGQKLPSIDWNKVGNHNWTSNCLEFDRGRHILYHFFLPSINWHASGNIDTPNQIEEVVTDAIEKPIVDLVDQIMNLPNFKSGLVVLVECDLGRGCISNNFSFNHTDWCFEFMTAADLITLSGLPEISPSYIWRILDGTYALKEAGVQIINVGGILNLIGSVQINHGRFFPKENLPNCEVSPEHPQNIPIGTNLSKLVRVAVSQRYDRHSSLDNKNNRHVVQRMSQYQLFWNKDSFLYVSIDDMRDGIMTSVYEDTRSFWISVNAPNIVNKNIERSLFEMACEWLQRIGLHLCLSAETGSDVEISKVQIQFCDTEPTEHCFTIQNQVDFTRLCTIESADEPNTCRVVFLSGFLDAFFIADNIAERLFVRTITRAFLQLSKSEHIDSEVDSIEALVFSDNNARYYRFSLSPRFIDLVREQLPSRFVFCDPIDKATARIGLGWQASEGKLIGVIDGRDQCKNILHSAVDKLLDEITDILSNINRRSVLFELIANIERARIDKIQWSNTSDAVISLHGEESESVILNELSKIDNTIVASSVLIEIALCASPNEGGTQITNIELNTLIARAFLVVFYGGLSDTFHYEMIASELIISSIGEIFYCGEFGELVVEPLISQELSDQFIQNSPFLINDFAESNDRVDSDCEDVKSFLEIWRSEMGFSVDEALTVLNILMEKGLHCQSPIFAISQSELINLVCSNSSVSKSSVEKFLNRFTLETRSEWREPPKGFKLKDIYPWRSGRRLSFSTRPILQTDSSQNPLLIVSPEALCKSIYIQLDGAYNARLEQSFFDCTKKLRARWGEAKDRQGLRFNSEVANQLKSAGWEVKVRVKISELLNCNLDRDYGDVDVMAWKPNRNVVLVIECKHFSLAWNFSRISKELSCYQGNSKNGKADLLKKHLDRVSLLQSNIEKLQQYTKVQNIEIESYLICSRNVPMQFAEIKSKVSYVGTVDEFMSKLNANS